MTEPKKANAVGINHVALEVGDIDAALAFYGGFLEFRLRSRGETHAFIDLGDQFIALAKVEGAPRDAERHFGLVVDDKAAAVAALEAMGVALISERSSDFYDPWGNRVQLVTYADIQFAKTPAALKGMGLDGLEKTEAALEELRAKGMAPE